MKKIVRQTNFLLLLIIGVTLGLEYHDLNDSIAFDIHEHFEEKVIENIKPERVEAEVQKEEVTNEDCVNIPQTNTVKEAEITGLAPIYE